MVRCASAELKFRCVSDLPETAGGGVTSGPPTSSASPEKQEPQKASVGTAFMVNGEGFALTNQHVVRGCVRIQGRLPGGEREGQIFATDETNDLALVKFPTRFESVAVFRSGRGIRAGDSVIAIGFPLQGLLASSPNVTTGAISAVSGVRDDVRFLQMTAPVQPGNSGGPLLDQSGQVVGIVVSKLNAVRVATITGDIPQNVNFAINGAIAKAFMDARGVDYRTSSSATKSETADIADRAGSYTIPLGCLK
jgi:S1-C subfamily serine protease